MTARPHKVGIIGLGVMGSPFALNILEQEMAVIAYDNDPKKIQEYREAFDGTDGIEAVNSLQSLVTALDAPRCIFLFLPSGEVIDKVLAELTPLLSKGDYVLDCGNSFFLDTDRRAVLLQQQGIHFLGTGISGGSSGARYGASLMVGGPKSAFNRVLPILKRVAAKYKDEYCVDHVGQNGAGHFTKMVHNGIEYGLMQLLAETYGFLKHYNYSNEQLHGIFSYFNSGPLASFLLEITAKIFTIEDPLSSDMLIDKISHKTGQKGTGKWTVQTALELNVPVPTLNAAVDMRNHSNQETLQESLRHIYTIQVPAATLDDDILEKVFNALLFGYITTFTQGFDLLLKGSAHYQYGISAARVARVWRAGCIIRTNLLDYVVSDFEAGDLQNVLEGEQISSLLKPTLEDAGAVLSLGNNSAIPMPALAACYSYFLTMTSGQLPTNLIQAQRDYFGGHGYERNDGKAMTSGPWKNQA